jgi:hypothetical protein
MTLTLPCTRLKKYFFKVVLKNQRSFSLARPMEDHSRCGLRLCTPEPARPPACRREPPQTQQRAAASQAWSVRPCNLTTLTVAHAKLIPVHVLNRELHPSGISAWTTGRPQRSGRETRRAEGWVGGGQSCRVPWPERWDWAPGGDRSGGETAQNWRAREGETTHKSACANEAIHTPEAHKTCLLLLRVNERHRP